MKLLGFNFTKISVEKEGERPENLKINTNIDISEIKEAKADLLKSNEEFIAVKFKFKVDYDPKHAKIDLEGNVLFSLEPKLVKEILDKWDDKEKNIPEDFRIVLFNIIMRKSNVKALELEDEMNLPLSVQLPTVRKENIKQEVPKQEPEEKTEDKKE